MKLRAIVILFFMVLATAMQAAPTKVSFADLQNGGWQRYQGQRVHITTPLIVCATMYDSLILAPERLFVPEERAVGLAQGDSTRYWQIANQNRSLRIKLECRYPYNLNLGATVTGLEAQVMGKRHLMTGAQPHFRNYRPSKRIPSLQKTQIRICAANIQNYFVHVGGYATRRTTPGQHALQCYKVASALISMHADLYALCELEQGDDAPRELVNKMNELCRRDCYDFLVTDTCDRDTISVGFIYDKTRIAPYGPLRFAYNMNDTAMAIYAHRFMLQGWQERATGQGFVVSLNHPRSKRGDPQEANRKRMGNTAAILAALDKAKADNCYDDSDYLLLGDYNAYAQEQPLQTIVQAGYQDMLTADTLNYTYSYKGECGYLDRCYASPTMAKQVVSVQPLHWNTDYYYSAAYYSKYNYKKRIIPKDVPRDIRQCLSAAAKKNLLFRYSDHDPLLITLKLE